LGQLALPATRIIRAAPANSSDLIVCFRLVCIRLLLPKIASEHPVPEIVGGFNS
jgi:hypothetical protein